MIKVKFRHELTAKACALVINFWRWGEASQKGKTLTIKWEPGVDMIIRLYDGEKA